MSLLFQIIVHTANVLGSFNDPFEFAGDYGSEVNPTREKVFEQIVAREALYPNETWAVEADKQHGPTLSALVTPELIQELQNKQKELQHLGFTENDLNALLAFVNRFEQQKVFHFFRNNPHDLLSLDKILRDKASREGKSFDLPILSSTQVLEGENAYQLKKRLLDRLFMEEVLLATKPEHVLKTALEELDADYLSRFLGEGAENDELQIFCRPAGQVFIYWLYQSLNLHLVSEDVGMIEEVNKVKNIFAATLGDPQVRAEVFKTKLIEANSSVVFTQESDTFVPKALTENGLFCSVDRQNPLDGTFIFLREDIWKSDYEVIALEDYEGYKKGRINVILATHKESGKKFLLASGHGNSTRPEDGRLQISLVKNKFDELSQLPENEGLQLLIGIDANTKSEEDVNDLRVHLDALGLQGTSVGPTTIKQRMVTAQHTKAGRSASDEEDYIITLKSGTLDDLTVGFNRESPDPSIVLPNIDNLSDHYPVGATFYY